MGVVLAPAFYDVNSKEQDEKMPEDHSEHFNHEHSMDHGELEVSAQNPPGLQISVEQDQMSGWNLKVKVQNFEFSPENVNMDNEVNRGHAHIYINGEKLTRLYAPYYHLSNLPPGEHEISVSLNANDHSTLTLNGQPIVAKHTIHQL